MSGNRLRAKESGDRFCLVLEYLRTFLCYLRLALLCAYKLHIHIVSVPKGFSTDARYDLLNGKYGQQKRILKMASFALSSCLQRNVFGVFLGL